ncbi:hypothetical protein AVEN_76185-1 [Araneus ventricosus]|uniref:Uncharacterized protein n=1 Tax=Araneus ventricosus TaxID=182803 RepID=A0A4Y2F112_ARAVE|nr:hypothetical protein AVEN_76185-1 [Araneus ventricosus]
MVGGYHVRNPIPPKNRRVCGSSARLIRRGQMSSRWHDAEVWRARCQLRFKITRTVPIKLSCCFKTGRNVTLSGYNSELVRNRSRAFSRKSKNMKCAVILVICALVASAYAAVDLAQFFEHFIAVGCTKTPSSGTTLPVKICGTCLRYTVDVRKIDAGLCSNSQG